MHGRLECVRLLLGLGARHDVCSGAGHSPLHVAAANHHCSVVRSLVEAGASMDAQNCHGNTPLHSAAATGAVDVVTVSRKREAHCNVGLIAASRSSFGSAVLAKGGTESQQQITRTWYLLEKKAIKKWYTTLPFFVCTKHRGDI